MSRPISITIDLDAIRQNFDYAHTVGNTASGNNSQTLAVIKADAYGHGAVATARALANKANLLAVSSIEEAVILRQNHIRSPILLLEGCFCASELSVVDDLGLQIVIHSQEQIHDLLSAELSKPINVWLKLDSGMHRLGVPLTDSLGVYQTLSNNQNVSSIVLMTHFATSDIPDHPLGIQQLDNFKIAVAAISQSKVRIPTSLANSAAIMAIPDSHGTWNRPGIMLYGISPFDQQNTLALPLVPAMQFCSKVIAIRNVNAGDPVGYGASWIANKPSIIATVAAGYGDGYPRTAKSGTPVLINGKIAPLAGRVSMDMLCVDVTHLDNVLVGAEVELWGKQLSVNEVAKWSDTLGYELVTRMPTRAKRIFINQ
ncbi:alanine racemase [Paraglaciecola sp. 20A4]|uniref:alanine racemase n=1 Tax=Paraglaciecola sp. 20A4 TaxID=2687288 RepID=UPI00140A82A9|nr:alanine racemase [Paraglaciecola sp. 20A4]QQM16052.1 D-alanine racemase [Paraglaciecola sp.]